MPPAAAAVVGVLGFAAGTTAAAITTAAVYGAIAGAVIGGVSSAIKGENIFKGALKGAAIGGITAGVLTGAGIGLGLITPAASGAGPAGAELGTAGTELGATASTGGFDAVSGEWIAGGATSGSSNPGLLASVKETGAYVSPLDKIAPATTPAAGGSPSAGWMSKLSDSKAASGLLQGAGQGAGSFLSAGKEAEARKELSEFERQNLLTDKAANKPALWDAQTANVNISDWWNRHLSPDKANTLLLGGQNA